MSLPHRTNLALFTLVFSAINITAVYSEQYIDVHVHIRGTSQSGMLGNLPEQQKDKSSARKGVFGKRLQRQPDGLSKNREANSPDSVEKNLEKAAIMAIDNMNKYGVAQALAVVVPGPSHLEEEYNSLKKVVSMHPDRFKLLAGGALLSPFLQGKDPVDITESDRKEFTRLAKKILADGAVGFGEMISYHLSMADHHSFQYAPPDHPLFMVLADIAAENNVAIDLHMEAITKTRPMPENLRKTSKKNPDKLEATIPGFERLLSHNRKARIVWQHIGWDNTGEMTPELVGELMEKHPNLYIALRIENRLQQVGNGPAMPNRLIDRNGKLNKNWRTMIEKFQDRIVIGSDEFFFPVDSQERPNQSFKETWSLLDQLTPELAKKIGRDNPVRIYALK